MCVISSLQINLTQKEDLGFIMNPWSFFLQNDIISTGHDRNGFLLQHRSVSRRLVKSKELLADLVSGDGHLASALSRKVHALAKEAIAQAHIQENVFLLHRFP